MFDEDRAHKLEELANLSRDSGDHETELKALQAMKQMKDELQVKIKNSNNPAEYLRTAPEADLEAKFPYPEKPIMHRGRERFYSDQLSGWNQQKQEIDKLREIAKINPYQSQNIKEMSGPEKLAVGYQTGLRDVARGVGLGGADEDTRRFENQLTQTSGTADVGRLAGESAPFLPASLAAGGIAGIVPRIAAQSAIGGAEGGIVASGTGQDTGGIVKSTLAGAAIGGGAEAIGSGISRLASDTLANNAEKQAIKPVASDAEQNAPLASESGGLTGDQIARNAAREDAFKKFGVMPTEAQRTRDKDLFRMQQDRAKAGGAVTATLDTQEQAFSGAANKTISDTGGEASNAAVSPIDVVVNKSLKQDQKISDAYKQASEASNKQKIIKFNNAAAILRQSAPANELSGGVVSALQGHLEQNGILTGFNPTGRISASTAEEMRKYANSLFPSTNDQGRAILRKFKDAIDNDTAMAVGEDAFAGARKAKADFEIGLDREKFNKFDERNVNVVRDILNNKLTPDEIQQGALIKAGSKYKAQDLAELKRYLHSGEAEDITAGAKAWNDVRASAMQRIKDAAFTGPETQMGTQSLSRAKLTQALNEIGQQKFNVLFSPKEKQFLYDLSAVARYKEPPSGTFNGSGPSAPAIKQLEDKIENIYGIKIPVISGIKGKLADKQLLKINDDLLQLEREKFQRELAPQRQIYNAATVSGVAAPSEDKK